MSACAPGYLPRRGAIRLRCSNCRANPPRRICRGFELPGDGSLPDRIEASFLPTRASSCRPRPRGCCSWRRPTRRVTPRCSFSRVREHGRSDRRAVSGREPTACSKLGPQVSVSPSASAFRDLSGGAVRRAARHASLAGGGDRPRARPRSPRLASRARDRWSPTRSVALELEPFRRACPRTRWTRRRRGVPRAIGGAHARPGSPGPPHVGSRHQQAPRRRPPGGVAAAHERGGRADGPVGASQARSSCTARSWISRRPRTRCRCSSTRPEQLERARRSPFAPRVSVRHTELHALPADSARGCPEAARAALQAPARPGRTPRRGPARRRAGASVHRVVTPLVCRR